MTSHASVNQLLSQAETSLTGIRHSLASADFSALASIERRLNDLVETLSKIERSVRIEPSLPIRESLLAVQTELEQSGQLSSLALRAITRQMESRNLVQPGPLRASLCFEG